MGGGRWLALALVPTGVVIAGCGAGSPPKPDASAKTATSPTTTTSTTTTSSSTATSSSTSPTSSTSTTSAPVTSAAAGGLPSGPGVLADCTNPPPQTLEVEPSTITLACADDGIGAQDLTWTTWTSTGASGSGTVWENDCTPDCASGTFHDFPATIALSDVRSSPDGPAFSVLTAIYSGAEPNGLPTETFQLELP